MSFLFNFIKLCCYYIAQGLLHNTVYVQTDVHSRLDYSYNVLNLWVCILPVLDLQSVIAVSKYKLVYFWLFYMDTISHFLVLCVCCVCMCICVCAHTQCLACTHEFALACMCLVSVYTHAFVYSLCVAVSRIKIACGHNDTHNQSVGQNRLICLYYAPVFANSTAMCQKASHSAQNTNRLLKPNPHNIP